LFLGYDERTWEPSQNLDNCYEKLEEYTLAKSKNKVLSATKEIKVVSLKNARTINYKKVGRSLDSSHETLQINFIYRLESFDSSLAVCIIIYLLYIYFLVLRW
jgi:hypothetical protein